MTRKDMEARRTALRRYLSNEYDPNIVVEIKNFPTGPSTPTAVI